MKLSAKKYVDEYTKIYKSIVSRLEDKISLTVIQVGGDEASSVYINQKKKKAEEIGITFNHVKIQETVSLDDILSKIQEVSKYTDGLMVQFPLPDKFSALEKNIIINSIPPEKDVDGLHPYNQGLNMVGDAKLKPCTPMGIIDLLSYYDIDVRGKNIAVFGRSDIVGKPLAIMLINKGATVTVCNSRTDKKFEHASTADIVILATGNKDIGKDINMIAHDKHPSRVIVDVGIMRREDGKLRGDFVGSEYSKDLELYFEYHTPVPGGVGPMTVISLMKNTITAYNIRKGGE